MEYIEAEDEFDIRPAEEMVKRRLDAEDEEVDVLTVDEVQRGREAATIFGAGEEANVEDVYVNGNAKEAEFRMPVLLDMGESDSEDEIVAIGTGQFRRKSTAHDDGDFMADEDDGLVNGNGHAGSKRRRDE